MKSIKITEQPQSKVIEISKLDEHDTTSVKSLSIRKEEKKYYDYSQDRKEIRYQQMFNFSSKYHYFVFLIMFQNSNEMIPICVRHALTFSGGKFHKILHSNLLINNMMFTGGFILQLITVGVLIVFPLMYVELFLGSYAQRTNSQIYKMAPIFFGNS